MPPKEAPKKLSAAKPTKAILTAGQIKGERSSNSTNTSTGSGRAGTSGRNKKFTKKKRPMQPIEVLFGEKLVNNAGDIMLSKRLAVENGVIGLYFGAKWCPPCKILLPELILLYEEVRKTDRKFEMIYISFDRSVESFQEYMSFMPWWAMGYDDLEQREDVAIRFNVRGIPIFMLIDARTLEIICKDGRQFVAYDPKGANFPWKNFTIPSVSTEAQKTESQVSRTKSKEKIGGPSKSNSDARISRSESKKDVVQPVTEVTEEQMRDLAVEETVTSTAATENGVERLKTSTSFHN